jgi:GMP synthase (glutamine-hydrolysing)|tara:strand:+ start:1660 stop:3189 length:1530 start_codon:yes stop_codon:yes gene_type:complete
MEEKVLIIDFGSQYTQLIARRIRELFIYCEIHPYNNLKVDLNSFKAVILSGSPFSVRSKDALHFDLTKIKGIKPLLGVCYGAQYIAHFNGGKVIPSNKREYGRANLSMIDNSDPLFNGIQSGTQVWMSHSDTIEDLPSGAKCIASTNDVINAAYSINNELVYGIQFHPEVYHTSKGKKILENFLINISNINPNWTPDSFSSITISEIKKTVGKEKVILGISGGVDSTVAAVLLNKAIGKNLHCIFVNNGLLRKNEFQNVLNQYEGMGLNVKGVDASKYFIDLLFNITDPEEKRKVIGRAFIDVFDKEAKLISGAKWLAQGTIYPDVIESISVKGPSATIKSHHNVGGLPDFMKLSVIEPLKMLFKDEVRRVGASLKIDQNLLKRHPFPGPGLAIRILGEITNEKIKILQEVDSIFIEGLKDYDLYDKVWQAGAMLLSVKSVGVMGDERTYEECVALRAVESTDGMTADWVNLPYQFLQEISNKIINNVKGVNRVVYDISSKPPATIEWE